VHQELVTIASEGIMEMKRAGKTLPADKIALLGTALNAPIDSTLDPDFVSEIQAAHVANNTPSPQGGNSPPPPNVTDITPYQTPLQSSVG
jgi:hypothetical protein